MPSITNPVSRFLSVSDAARSIAFYRDVLGFDVRATPHDYGVDIVAELVRGAAVIQLTTASSAPDSTGESRLRGSAILFFETSDVDVMRKEFIARGGAPSEIEKANWVKMRMFEIRDPDGHVLWFGRSFQEPAVEQPEPMLRQIMPNFPVADVAASVAYYRDVLGFSVNYAQHDISVMDRDKARILLVERTPQYTGIGSCYVYVRDADALHAELLAKGANVQGEPISRPWGLREFAVLDPDLNQITFGQTFE